MLEPAGGTGAGCFEASPRILRIDDIGIREHVFGRDDGSPADGQANHPRARRQAIRPVEGDAGLGRDGDRPHITGGLEIVQGGGRGVIEQCPYPRRDALPHQSGIERLREHLRDLGHRVPFTAPLLARLEEPAILDRDRDSVAELLGDREISRAVPSA